MHLAVCNPVKPVLNEEMPIHAWVKDEIIRADRQANPYPYIFQAIFLGGQRSQQTGRFGCSHGNTHGLMRLDLRHRFWNADQLLLVKITWIH
jgi:hypothetical protein